MSQYEFEGSNEGDWDDTGDLAWNESDWQVFLRNSDKEVVRFMTAYNQVKEQDDRLDAAASLMGWHRDDCYSSVLHSHIRLDHSQERIHYSRIGDD